MDYLNQQFCNLLFFKAMQPEGREMLLQKREAILEAKVEYSPQEDSNIESRRISEDSKERQLIEDLVTQTLTGTLPRALESLFGLKVLIHIKGKRYGSLSVFFGAVLGAYVGVSRYKNFYDSIRLIRQQAQDLLTIALRPYGKFSVGVYDRYPMVDDPDWWEWPFPRLRRYPPVNLETEFLGSELPAYQRKRDGFFWFLFALCIMALGGIGLLVYGAVVKMYFK